uniref:RING-type E3 ubiquitin transferase n=1 Tax=Cannabis sativa TaxID=3483 RepID=A0A803QQW7_CANSA
RTTTNPMSSQEQALLSLLSHLAFSGDGAVLGLALAYAAVRSILKYRTTSSALKKLRKAPSVKVSDLRSVMAIDNSDTSNESQSSDGKILIVRGTVEAKSVIDGSWKSLRPSVLVSQESGEKAVIIQRTQTVPFVLVEGGKWPASDFIVVNIDKLKHPLPLTTVYHQLQPVNASPYTFLQALFGHEFPVGLLDEEKILPLGKDITAVGVCSIKDGTPEINSCKDLPYFLTEMTKDEMVVDLAFRSKILLLSGAVLGSLSVGILGYAVVRNWNKLKEWRQRRHQQSNPPANDDNEFHISEEDDTTDVPDGQLCVICLTRRRRSAFVPCGHLVCCQSCAISVEHAATPKCPLCRQEIRSSVRIYDS